MFFRNAARRLRGKDDAMRRLKYSITIDAPRTKVWEAMLGKSTYNEWTSAFHPTSRYEGDWNEGSEILFLATMDDGSVGGMVSRVHESRPYEKVDLEHLGVVKDGEKVMSGP